MSLRFLSVCGIMLGLASFGGAEAQTCEACRATVLGRVALEIPESEGGVFGNPLGVAVDGRGRVWVVFQDQLPAVFSPDGKFLFRFGKKGQGPGEFSDITRVVPLPGDSVAIVDPGNHRLTILGPDLQVGRDLRMESPISQAAILEWPGKVMVNGPVMSMAGAGWPLHLVDLSGEGVLVQRSFGADEGEITADHSEILKLRRHLLSTEQGVWAAHRYQILARLWQEDGTETETLSAAGVHWFGDPLAELASSPIPNNVAGLFFDDRERLMQIYAGRVDKDLLQEAFEGVRANVTASGARSVSAAQMPPEAVYRRSHLLLLDRASNLVADLALDGLVVAVASDGRVLVARPDDNDVLALTLERIGVSGLSR